MNAYGLTDNLGHELRGPADFKLCFLQFSGLFKQIGALVQSEAPRGAGNRPGSFIPVPPSRCWMGALWKIVKAHEGAPQFDSLKVRA